MDIIIDFLGRVRYNEDIAKNVNHSKTRRIVIMEKNISSRICFIEVAKDIYVAVTPAKELDITDAGLMDNFSNAAYINRGSGLVCDTYYDLPHARELKEFCVQKSGHAPGCVVNTHGHWDHYWGNQVFSEACIMGHTDMRKDCGNDKGKLFAFKLLNKSKMVQSLAENMMGKQFKDYLPENQKFHFLVKVTEHDFDLRGVSPTMPNMWFDKSTSLDLDGTEVKLLPLGAVHSSSDTVVWIPSEKVLFAGDIFADCSLPVSLESAKRWIEVMNYILDDLKPEIIVPGHGVVYGRARAESQREYFCSLVEQFERYYTDTIDFKELCDKIDVRQYLVQRPRVGWVMALNSMFTAKRKM